MFRFFWSRAARLNQKGNKLADQERFPEAEAAYRGAAEADPAWSVPWYNLGLMFKKQRDWKQSLLHNRRATELNPSEADGWWNLGIAATALGEWVMAREAWRACGIKNIPDGNGPIEMNLGPTPVRLNDAGDGEVVWGRRIDPARVVLVSVPLPKSGFRWQDVVLHDGAANGYRILNGHKIPVFDVLQRMTPSNFSTFVAELDAVERKDLAVIEGVAAELGGAAEDWSTTVQQICKQCSEGTPHHRHDIDQAKPAYPYCGVAARDDSHLQAILDTWVARVRQGRVVRWYRP